MASMVQCSLLMHGICLRLQRHHALRQHSAQHWEQAEAVALLPVERWHALCQCAGPRRTSARVGPIQGWSPRPSWCSSAAATRSATVTLLGGCTWSPSCTVTSHNPCLRRRPVTVIVRTLSARRGEQASQSSTSHRAGLQSLFASPSCRAHVPGLRNPVLQGCSTEQCQPTWTILQPGG